MIFCCWMNIFLSQKTTEGGKNLCLVGCFLEVIRQALVPVANPLQFLKETAMELLRWCLALWGLIQRLRKKISTVYEYVLGRKNWWPGLGFAGDQKSKFYNRAQEAWTKQTIAGIFESCITISTNQCCTSCYYWTLSGCLAKGNMHGISEYI